MRKVDIERIALDMKRYAVDVLIGAMIANGEDPADDPELYRNYLTQLGVTIAAEFNEMTRK